MTIIGRYFTDLTMQELRQREDGAYEMRTFNLDPDSERVVTSAEAGEWVDAMRHNGGSVYHNCVPWPVKGAT